MLRFLLILALLVANLWQSVTTSTGRHRNLSIAQVDPCTLPADLNEAIAHKYPDTRVLQVTDLDKHAQKLFREDHGARCPGLVKVNFYGDKEPALAMVLISGKNPKIKAALVVARNRDKRWEPESLETTDGTPVVWSQKPGKYQGIADAKPIIAAHPVIVFCGYESWAIVYAWTAHGIAKTWISD